MKFRIAFFCWLFLSSCTINRKIYSPAEVINPSLQKQNDYSVSLSYGTPSGFDLSGGYAITNRFAIIAGAFTHKNTDREEEYFLFSDKRDSSILLYKHKGFQLGAGFYIPLDRDKKTIFLSFFGGYIKGNFEMNEKLYQTNPTPSVNPKLNTYKSGLNRYFLQGSINSYWPQVHLSFTSRLIYAGYTHVITDYDNNEQTAYRLPPNGYPKWSSFYDFSLLSRFFFTKKEQVGLQLSCLATGRLHKEEFNFDYYPFRASMGIVFRPGAKNKP